MIRGENLRGEKKVYDYNNEEEENKIRLSYFLVKV